MIAEGDPRAVRSSAARRRPRWVSSSHLVIALASFALVAPWPVASQQGVTLIGVVVDSTSGAPIAGALITVGAPARQALTDVQGRFRIEAATAGTQRVVVQRFGYRSLEGAVTVSADMTPLELRLAPNPIELDELRVLGNARADVRGVVVNAHSGEPVPFTDLTLTRDAVQQVGRKESADDRGEFTISDILAGAYLLRVERLGFESLYVPVSHSVPTLPIEVRLVPDSALIRGLAIMNSELGTRRTAHAHSAGVFEERRLRLAPLTNMRQFFDTHGTLLIVECGDPPRRTCIQVRGRPARPVIYIDGFRVADPPPARRAQPPPTNRGRASSATPADPAPVGLEQLDTFSPQDFYLIEYFECAGGVMDVPAAALSGAAVLQPYIEVHAYTRSYMERMGRRPRIPLPACLR